MKRIAIFCDGTWNRYDAPHPTNVVRMAQAVQREAPGEDGVPVVQVPVYVLGIGTGGGTTSVGATVDRYLGGAFGAGLTQSLEEAYRQLAFLYQPGDEVYVFGFSRGAYMARSLIGLIRSAGIPPLSNLGRIPAAVARYRQRTPDSVVVKEGEYPQFHPSSESSHRFRLDFSPQIATSAAEVEWRLAQGAPAPQLLTIRYLGVFDTVGALGVPGFFASAPLLNRDLQFHDTMLTSMVLSARHALAIDERRRTFEPTLWGNTDELNRGALELESVGDLAAIPREKLKYREEWFPGDHGSVGGGGVHKGLSAYTLGWIAEGSATEGLAFDPAVLDAVAGERDIGAPIHNQDAGTLTWLMRQIARDREGPGTEALVSEPGCERVRTIEDYRPGSLARVLQALLGS